MRDDRTPKIGVALSGGGVRGLAHLGVLQVMEGAEVPVDFVADFDPQEQRVELSVPLSAVMGETWDREPSFIAGHQDKAEELA